MDFFKQHIEALIFVSPQAISLQEIQGVLREVLDKKVKEDDILEVIKSLQEKYAADDYAFELVEIAEGYQFMTKGAYHNTIAIHLKQTTKKRLTRAALETLAIVAYKQPVNKSDLEAIRGVNCDYALQKLLEKELVIITGRSEGPGRPLLYSTSEKFMDYLGIKSLTDLPKPKDFKEVENMIGETPLADETVIEAGNEGEQTDQQPVE